MRFSVFSPPFLGRSDKGAKQPKYPVIYEFSFARFIPLNLREKHGGWPGKFKGAKTKGGNAYLNSVFCFLAPFFRSGRKSRKLDSSRLSPTTRAKKVTRIRVNFGSFTSGDRGEAKITVVHYSPYQHVTYPLQTPFMSSGISAVFTTVAGCTFFRKQHAHASTFLIFRYRNPDINEIYPARHLFLEIQKQNQ